MLEKNEKIKSREEGPKHCNNKQMRRKEEGRDRTLKVTSCFHPSMHITREREREIQSRESNP